MRVNLYLGSDEFIRHNEIITLPVDSVILDLSPGAYVLGEKIVTVIAAGREMQYRYNEPLDISEHFTKAGEVNVAVSLVIRGEVARTWQIEPFCVKEIPGGFEAIPEIEALKARICMLEKAVAETASLIEN